jgi:hypothetical protein
MTIAEMDLLNLALLYRYNDVENLTATQRDQITHYFGDLRENLESYCKNGRKKIVSIMRDV